MIDKTIPPIGKFPKDDKLRVVWMYGAVYKNIGRTRTPEIKIMLKEILPSGELSTIQIFRKISIAQLDIARHMTIWRGNRRTISLWKSFNDGYEADKLFSLKTETSKSISFTEKKPNSDYGHFPPYKYKMDRIENKSDYWDFANATFTKIESDHGVTVIIPSMELFTSTYVPQEQKLRNRLLQYRLDDILAVYIKSGQIIGDNYHLELYGSKLETNIAFLAYAKFNNVSRQRLSKLFASLEISSNFPERYPVVLPYHPTEIEVQGDGIWLDKTTFFMFRINKYSLPRDNEIESYALELEFEDDESQKKKKQYVKAPQELDDIDTPITNDYNPHTKNASQHILSEVSTLNANNTRIKHRKKSITVLNNVDLKIDVDNTEDITQISSGEADRTSDSENTGNIKIDSKEEKSYLQQSDVLKLVISALNYLKDEKVNISDSKDEAFIGKIYFVDEVCALSEQQMTTQFSRVLIQSGREVEVWARKVKNEKYGRKFIGYRNYMLLKIVLSDNRYAYLFEIDKKDTENGFSGMILELAHLNEEIDIYTLSELLNEVMLHQGVLKKVEIVTLKKMTFKHAIKNDTLNENMKNTLRRAMKKGLFSSK
jgi:hypothetical protein